MQLKYYTRKHGIENKLSPLHSASVHSNWYVLRRQCSLSCCLQNSGIDFVCKQLLGINGVRTGEQWSPCKCVFGYRKYSKRLVTRCSIRVSVISRSCLKGLGRHYNEHFFGFRPFIWYDSYLISGVKYQVIKECLDCARKMNHFGIDLKAMRKILAMSFFVF